MVPVYHRAASHALTWPSHEANIKAISGTSAWARSRCHAHSHMPHDVKMKNVSRVDGLRTVLFLPLVPIFNAPISYTYLPFFPQAIAHVMSCTSPSPQIWGGGGGCSRRTSSKSVELVKTHQGPARLMSWSRWDSLNHSHLSILEPAYLMTKILLKLPHSSQIYR
jgi:hypothetical protein